MNKKNAGLFSDLSSLIEEARSAVRTHANSTLTMLFWHIGKRINEDILQNKRAEYGKQIIPDMAVQLSGKYGKNFELRNLWRMMQFAEEFPDEQIVVTLSRQLSWSRFLAIIPQKTPEARQFYAHLAHDEMLSVRELRRQIETKAFERTEIANTQLDVHSVIPPDVFKDPYIMDFLELKNTYLEKDLEAALLRELEMVILELGKHFTFVERQKRMIIDGEDFYLDLLFYNRKLKRLVAVELKLGKFEARFKGQMELYLKWLNKYEKMEGENHPVGLILCAEGSREQIELLEMHKDGIMLAEYWTELLPKKALEQKLHTLLLEARERIEAREIADHAEETGKD